MNKKIVKEIMNISSSLIKIANIIIKENEYIDGVVVEKDFTDINIKGKMNHNSNTKGETYNLKKGSISKRKDGRYMGRYGKNICVYSKYKKECIEKLEQAILEHDKSNNKLEINKNMTLNTWIKYWFDMYKKEKLKASTYRVTENVYKSHLENSTFAKKQLNKITPMDIKEFISNLKSEDSKKKCYAILKDVFDKAHKNGFIKQNTIELLVLKFDNYKNEEKIPLTVENESKLFNFLKNKKIYAICKTILLTGMRKGEALALTWADVDFQNKKIRISKNYDSLNKIITTPKTSSSIRSIPIFDELYSFLIDYKPINSKPTDRLFNNIKPSSLSVNFTAYCKKLGIKASIHVLRHTFATKCFEIGIEPKVVQEWLGHASYEVTIRTYTHISTDLESSQIDKINQNIKKY